MKKYIVLLLIQILLTRGLIAGEYNANGRIQLRGVMQHHAGLSFALYDSEGKELSPWLKLNATWRGYTLKSYDLKAQFLTLSKDGTAEKLYMQASAVESAPLLRLPSKKTELVAGSFTLESNSKVYSDDAKLRTGGGALVTSPSGVMVSDQGVSAIHGDLSVKIAGGSIKALGATVRETDRGEYLTAKQITWLPEKRTKVPLVPAVSPPN